VRLLHAHGDAARVQRRLAVTDPRVGKGALLQFRVRYVPMPVRYVFTSTAHDISVLSGCLRYRSAFPRLLVSRLPQAPIDVPSRMATLSPDG